jgi:hypothetical protein
MTKEHLQNGNSATFLLGGFNLDNGIKFTYKQYSQPTKPTK